MSDISDSVALGCLFQVLLGYVGLFVLGFFLNKTKHGVGILLSAVLCIWLVSVQMQRIYGMN